MSKFQFTLGLALGLFFTAIHTGIFIVLTLILVELQKVIGTPRNTVTSYPGPRAALYLRTTDWPSRDLYNGI
jgi:hypothetical protein